MDGKLRGRVAMITGASRGLGAATARLFQSEGAKVVLLDILQSDGEKLARELGSDVAIFRKLDTTQEDAWGHIVAETIKQWGTIDILINNAGVVHPASIIDLKKADFERVLQINLIGAWLGMKSVAPAMIAQRKGVIINICSTSGLWGMNGLAAYSSSKWALRGLTKTAAMELGLQGIRVNAVFPGGFNTPMGNITNELVADLAKYYQRQPIQRIGEPLEVAQTNLFLASDAASYLCGAEIAVDGGMSLGMYNDFLPGGPGS